MAIKWPVIDSLAEMYPEVKKLNRAYHEQKREIEKLTAELREWKIERTFHMTSPVHGFVDTRSTDQPVS